MTASPPRPRKGRGAGFNPANRFRRDEREAFDDGWTAPPAEDEEPPPLKTTVSIRRARTIIA
ncbi:MAG TPA: radical SAM protein, partial [Casimicrobiaceae bacterium]|nr:radical SAM protein [Casimicrobiaceae bacterium]